MNRILCLLAVLLLLGVSAFGQGQVDSVIIGSVNVDSGSVSVSIPIWVTTVDTCETIFWRLCLRSPNENDARFTQVEYFYPLNVWDMRFDTTMQNGRSLGITAFAQLDPGPGPYPLFTNNQRWNILTLRIELDPTMSPRQIIVDSLSAIHLGRNGSVFVPGIINTGPLTVDNNTILPGTVRLSQNYPNPFNAQTTIQYSLSEQLTVSIDIFDILGRKIETIVEGEMPSGDHQAIWDASGQSSGIYFYRIKAGDIVETKKVVLMK